MDTIIQHLLGYAPSIILSLFVFIIVVVVSLIMKKFKLQRQNNKQYIQVLFKEENTPYDLGEKLGAIKPVLFLRILFCLFVCLFTIFIYFVWTSKHPEMVELRKVISILIVMWAIICFGTFSFLRRHLSIYSNGIKYCYGLVKKEIYFSEIESMTPILLKENTTYNSVHIATHQTVEAYTLELRDGKTMKLKVGRFSNIYQLSLYLNIEKNPYIASYRYVCFQSNRRN